MPSVKDMPVIFISPDHNEKYRARKLKTESLLQKIGFSDITHFKSNLEYPKCLADATIEILESHLDDKPILVVEDDIGWTGVVDIDIPENVDAIYLGNSIWASHPTLETNVAYCQLGEYSKSQLRVFNMLGAHAVLYISRRYKEKVIYQLKNHLQYFSDIAISRIQKDFLVLTNKIPVFFQDEDVNRSITNVSFEKTNGILSIKPI